MTSKGFILGGMIAAVFLFSTTGILQGAWISPRNVNAQTDSTSNQTAVIDQLVSNLTQAKEAVGSGNSTAVTMRLTAIIGELSDILGKATTDENGQYLDEHTHFFSHKGDTHTVTHKHPHNADHHHHDHGNWFERHHIFNPSDCKPGLMC